MWGQKHREKKASAEAEHTVVKQAADVALYDRFANIAKLVKALDIPMEEHLSDLAAIIAKGDSK